MKIHRLEEAIQEARRFLDRADDALAATHEEQKRTDRMCSDLESNPIENGALRRSSMDLTRSLAALRKGSL